MSILAVRAFHTWLQGLQNGTNTIVLTFTVASGKQSNFYQCVTSLQPVVWFPWQRRRRNFHQKYHFQHRVPDLSPPPTPHLPTPPPAHPPPSSPYCYIMLLMQFHCKASSHLHIICIYLQINENDEINEKSLGTRGLITNVDQSRFFKTRAYLFSDCFKLTA